MTLPALQNTSVIYRRILSQFPQDISLAFAYGSGVFKQHGTNQGQMEVSDLQVFHLYTLFMKHKSHYSSVYKCVCMDLCVRVDMSFLNCL